MEGRFWNRNGHDTENDLEIHDLGREIEKFKKDLGTNSRARTTRRKRKRQVRPATHKVTDVETETDTESVDVAVAADIPLSNSFDILRESSSDDLDEIVTLDRKRTNEVKNIVEDKASALARILFNDTRPTLVQKIERLKKYISFREREWEIEKNALIQANEDAHSVLTNFPLIFTDQGEDFYRVIPAPAKVPPRTSWRRRTTTTTRSP